jgi:EAL domain-containing protein (putative c-di-GMP-specific phosphodiesterase class I)
VLQLAAQLGLHVVLEGVERRDELAFARLHDARYGQGFFLSRPVPVQELPSLLAIRRAGTFKHASKRFRVI